MVLASDFAYGVAGARFALTEVTIGIMPGAGGTQTLPRIVGERRAKEIILTGRPFTAQDACDWGILNRVLDTREALTEAVMETARTIARNAPLSVRQAKRSMHFGLQMDLRSALRFEVECYNQLVGTEDRHEGIASFNEKRKPVFKGR
jgi:enoyl-CoA hydratase/carnithine racemase